MNLKFYNVWKNKQANNQPNKNITINIIKLYNIWIYMNINHAREHGIHSIKIIFLNK